MKQLKYLSIIICIILAAYAAFITAFQFSPKVIIKANPEYKETSYVIIDEDDKEISLTTYQTDLNKHVLRLRSNSALPLNKQISRLDLILAKVLQNINKSELKTLFIGRLVNAFGENKEISERLKIAAKKHPNQNSNINDYVVEIANKAMIYPELKEMLRKHGLEIKFSSAEKVLIKPSDKLPYDCLAWFSIKIIP